MGNTTSYSKKPHKYLTAVEIAKLTKHKYEAKRAEAFIDIENRLKKGKFQKTGVMFSDYGIHSRAQFLKDLREHLKSLGFQHVRVGFCKADDRFWWECAID